MLWFSWFGTFYAGKNVLTLIQFSLIREHSHLPSSSGLHLIVSDKT